MPDAQRGIRPKKIRTATGPCPDRQVGTSI